MLGVKKEKKKQRLALFHQRSLDPIQLVGHVNSSVNIGIRVL